MYKIYISYAIAYIVKYKKLKKKITAMSKNI